MRKRCTGKILIVVILFLFACAGSSHAATLSGVGFKYTGLMLFTQSGLVSQMFPAVDVIFEFNPKNRAEGIFWFGPGGIAAMGVGYTSRLAAGKIYNPYLGLEVLFSGALLLTLKGGVEIDFGRTSVYAGAGYVNAFGYVYQGFMGAECGIRYYFGRPAA